MYLGPCEISEAAIQGYICRSIHLMRSIKKLFLKISQYLQESTCVDRKVPVLEILFNKETPTRVFSCGYCEIFKNTYLEEHLRTAASETMYM